MAIRPARGDLPVSRASVSGAPRQFAWRTAPARPARRSPCHQGFHVTFASLALHPSLLRGLKELGFTRPTPIQTDAIPPALEGRDVLACATTGSGKTAAFLLPILHRLIERPRGTTRALVLTPTRELAAQILEDLNDLAVHTPITAAAIYGGVGMGPQEHAFRSGVDVIVATPGRLLDHLKHSYARLARHRAPRPRRGRPDARHGLPAGHPAHPEAPPDQAADAVLQRHHAAADRPARAEMLRNPATINLERKAAPAIGITQAVYPVAQDLKSSPCWQLLERGDMQDAAGLHAHQAPRRPARRSSLPSTASPPSASTATARSRSAPRRSPASRAGSIASSWRPTSPRAASTSRSSGTWSTSTCPWRRRTTSIASAAPGAPQATGDAFTFVSPEEEADLARHRAKLGRGCHA